MEEDLEDDLEDEVDDDDEEGTGTGSKRKRGTPKVCSRTQYNN